VTEIKSKMFRLSGETVDRIEAEVKNSNFRNVSTLVDSVLARHCDEQDNKREDVLLWIKNSRLPEPPNGYEIFLRKKTSV
jgi:hypothetical protein